MRKRESKDFYHNFHWFIESNHLTADWNSFEDSELIKFASIWCEQNHIKYTIKQ